MSLSQFFGIVLAILRTNATFFTQEIMEEIYWSPYHLVNDISQDTACAMFMHNKSGSSCALALSEAGCFLSRVDQTTEAILTVHRNLDLQLHMLPTDAQATVAVEDRSHWDVLASSIYEGTHLADYVLDGLTQPPAYPGTYASTAVEHPWFRIDLKRKYLIQGGRITVRSQFKARLGYSEIRVGNDGVDGSSESEMICKNQLCYMTGNSNVVDLSFDCMNPIIGRVVTVQKYSTIQQILEFTEIFLTAYCGPLSSVKDQCQYGDQYHVDHCAMKEQYKDASVHLASVIEKQNWILTTGPTTNGYGTIDRLIDGVKGGGSSKYFHTPPKDTALHYSFPWVQVDFTVQKIVQGVHLYGRTDASAGVQILHVEVRVGNVNAGAITPIGQRICANALCKTTGSGTAVANQVDDCSGGPLLGQYVTVQRYLGLPHVIHPALVMTEIDIKLVDT